MHVPLAGGKDDGDVAAHNATADDYYALRAARHEASALIELHLSRDRIIKRKPARPGPCYTLGRIATGEKVMRRRLTSLTLLLAASLIYFPAAVAQFDAERAYRQSEAVKKY